MSIETARIIFLGIIVVSGFVWLISLSLALRIGRSATQNHDVDWQHPNQPADDDQTGHVTVPGEPASVCDRLARTILDANLKSTGAAYKIVERTGNRLVIEQVGKYRVHGQPGICFTRGEFHFSSSHYNQVEVEYQLHYDRFTQQQRRIALGLILLLGLPTMVALSLLMWHYVIPNPNQAIRWQVLQTLQLIHVIWPPFLPIGIYNFGRRSAKIWVETLLATLQIADQPQTI